MNKLKKKLNKRGFTLIEIIVVIVIMAVLMAIAVPSVLKYVDEANNAKYISTARSAFNIAQASVVKDTIEQNDEDETYYAVPTSEYKELADSSPSVRWLTMQLDDEKKIVVVCVSFTDGKYALVYPNDKVEVH
jgi:prepilin-type N-terminal cleavage/methylation domain-containing protein